MDLDGLAELQILALGLDQPAGVAAAAAAAAGWLGRATDVPILDEIPTFVCVLPISERTKSDRGQ